MLSAAIFSSLNHCSCENKIDLLQESFSGLDKSSRRIWCFGPVSTSKIENQRYYLPIRFLCALRKTDFIILPGNHKPTYEFVEFMINLLDLDPNQIIWTSGRHFELDKDIDSNILYDIINRHPRDDWTLIPYSCSNEFYKWSLPLIERCLANSTKLSVFGETAEWIESYGNKGILHRKIRNLSEPSVVEVIDNSIPVANGYMAYDVGELVEAFELLKAKHSNNIAFQAVIKPIYGSAGEGITFVSSLQEIKDYDFPMGPVVLEEYLQLDFSPDGFIISPAVHYLGSKLLGKRTVDQLMKKTSYLGWRESVASLDFQKKVLDITKRIMDFTQPKVK
jgi:hypothetical protein